MWFKVPAAVITLERRERGLPLHTPPPPGAHRALREGGGHPPFRLTKGSVIWVQPGAGQGTAQSRGPGARLPVDFCI